MNRVLVVMEIRTKAFVPEADLAGCPEVLDMILVDAFKEGGVAWCKISKIPGTILDNEQLVPQSHVSGNC